MAVPYHTHTFEIPVASKTETGEVSISNKVVVPSSLGTAAVLDEGDLATAAQGALADSAVQPGDLGDSAALNVGTSPGTVAAGDDSRITGAAQKASNLSDLADAATARTNLGLGGSATLNVGTSAGTVAAGDDARIVGAAQKASNLSDLADASAARTNLGVAIGSDVQEFSSILSGVAGGSFSAPSWGTYDSPYTPLKVTINGYPDVALAGGDQVGVTHVITGAVTIPDSANNPLAVFASGIAGYARSYNSTSVFQQAVGVYGAGLAAATSTSAWGANFIVANLEDLAEPQANQGNNNINLWGIEVDMNVQAQTGGVAPGGNAVGIDLVGNSGIAPLGFFNGIKIQAAGLYSDVQWKEGITFYTATIEGSPVGSSDDGIVFQAGSITNTAIKIGQQNASGLSGSQPVSFYGRNSGGTQTSATLRTDPDGNYLITAQAGATAGFTKSDLSGALSAGDPGVFINVSLLPNAANDAAAAALGVGVNRMYRNGSVLMVRVS